MIQLTDQVFDPAQALSTFSAGRTGVGAIASFVGLARGQEAGMAVLELDAYEGFTQAAIEGFVAEARLRFQLIDVEIIHRIGRIAVGEPIVMVLTAAAHRREAFEACDFLMDYLKSQAPLWKKEFGPQGPRWVEPTARDHSDLARWTSGAGGASVPVQSQGGPL
jgi:molybdopterin synthase catalytic subunit